MEARWMKRKNDNNEDEKFYPITHKNAVVGLAEELDAMGTDVKEMNVLKVSSEAEEKVEIDEDAPEIPMIIQSAIDQAKLETTEKISVLDQELENVLENKLDKTGGTMTGTLKFDNTNTFTMLEKTRTVDDVLYRICYGLGNYGGRGSCAFELWDNDTNTQLARVDIAPNSFRYLNETGNYKIYGEHNYQDIKLGQTLTMYDGVNNRNVICCYDDGDSTNYGSEVVICGAGNMYIGSGESATNLYKEMGVRNTEYMYVTSDNLISFYVNCNTIANRKGISMYTDGTFRPEANGGFTLGTSTYKWGQIYSTASSISTSDRNEKNNINPVDMETVENLIMGLRPVTYKFNDGSSDRTHYGLIAQDVEELLEELNIPSQDFAAFIKSQKETFNSETGENNLVYDADGNPEYIYGLRYEEFIAPLIKMVQVQQEEIKDLKSRLEKIERLINLNTEEVTA